MVCRRLESDASRCPADQGQIVLGIIRRGAPFLSDVTTSWTPTEKVGRRMPVRAFLSILLRQLPFKARFVSAMTGQDQSLAESQSEAGAQTVS